MGSEGNANLLDLERIRQLVEMMVANDLVELSLRDGEIEVCLRRPNSKAAEPVMTMVPASPAHSIPGASMHSNPGTHTAGPPPVVEPELHEIRSPMVGTFYTAPDPDTPAFVQVGSAVGPNTVVCLLEAMKVFSEIKAETSGVIERVLARDGEAVEYGQALFLVRPH